MSTVRQKPPESVLLDRLLRQERENIRLVARLAPPPRFEDVFELYRTSGFLYPEKLAALRGQMPSIERTWRRALAPDSRIFRLIGRLGVVDGVLRLRNSISAFVYAPGTWQGQHLVSLQRHEFTGTLAVLTELVEGLHHEGAPHIRLCFRPNNPGTRMLFGEVLRRLSPDQCKLAVCDYGCMPHDRVQLPATPVSRLTVKSVAPDQSRLVEEFYGRVLHPVEVASLGLRDPGLRQVDAAYGAAGLHRTRKVLVAIEHGEIVGACLVHDSAVGLNLSFLENAIEHLRVRPDLSGRRHEEVWTALATAAVGEARSRGGNVVVALEPGDRELSVRAGLVTADPKQYAVLTAARRGDSYLRSIDCFLDYYRALLAAEAAA